MCEFTGIIAELTAIKQLFPELRYGQGYIHCNPDLGGTSLDFYIWENDNLQQVAWSIFVYQFLRRR